MGFVPPKLPPPRENRTAARLRGITPEEEIIRKLKEWNAAQKQDMTHEEKLQAYIDWLNTQFLPQEEPTENGHIEPKDHRRLELP
jgi:hypothetical protein